MQLEGPHKLSQWVWAAKRNLVHFRHKFAPFDCSMTNDFLCLLSVNEESFRDISLIHCPGRKKDSENTICQPSGEREIESFFGGWGIPSKRRLE